MQSLEISKGLLKSEVRIPPSKSYANRAIILAAVTPRPIIIHHLPDSTDVTILVDCLIKLGLNIKQNKNQITVSSSFPECEKGSVTLEVGEGGTTARFLATMLLLGTESYKLILGTRLKNRPWEEFIKLTNDLGGFAQLKGNELSLKGPLKLPPRLEIDCARTTQFATGFKLSLAHKNIKIVAKNLKASKSYWLMSEKIIEELEHSSEYAVPLDWSSASFPLAFGALNQEISFPDLKVDDYQADSKFFNILEKFKAITATPSGLKVHPTTIQKNFVFDVSDALDLVPALSYFLAHIPGNHELTGVINLSYKESDRLNEIVDLLKKFNRKASTNGHSIFIKGSTERLRDKIILNLPDDHRMVMVGTLFLLHHNGGSIAPIDSVAKSYPTFFQLIQ